MEVPVQAQVDVAEPVKEEQEGGEVNDKIRKNGPKNVEKDNHPDPPVTQEVTTIKVEEEHEDEQVSEGSKDDNTMEKGELEEEREEESNEEEDTDGEKENEQETGGYADADKEKPENDELPDEESDNQDTETSEDIDLKTEDKELLVEDLVESEGDTIEDDDDIPVFDRPPVTSNRTAKTITIEKWIKNVRKAHKKPNVLFIVADDMRPEIGANLHEKSPWLEPGIVTPNLDVLASESLLFRRAYCQISWCNPSRSSFLTSRRPDTTMVHNNSVLSTEHA
jgi:hypothetical protein